MKEQKIWIGVGIVFIILLIFIFGRGEGVPVTREDGSVEGEYSIANIMEIGKPYQCTFSKTDGSSTISGALNITDGKIRGDFDIKLEALDGGTFASHLIVKDGYSYTWTSIQPIGYKAKIAEKSATSKDAEKQAQLVGIEDKVNYKCTPWNANLTVFDLPKGITFSELTETP